MTTRNFIPFDANASKSDKASEWLLPLDVRTCADYFNLSEYEVRRCSQPDGSGTGYIPTFPALVDNKLRKRFSLLFPTTAKAIADSISYSLKRPSGETIKPVPFLERVKKLPLNPKAFRYDRAVGIEVETSCPLSVADAQAHMPHYVRTVSDGSIRPFAQMHGVEFTMLLKRSDMEPRLHRTLSIIQSLGCTVNKSCGLHIHFDMRGKSSAEVQKLGRKLTGWLKALSELVLASRRTNDQYCRLAYSATSRYCAVNVTAFSKHQTLEVRLHSASLDYTKVLCWIRLCELLLAMKAAPRCENTLSALATLPLADHERAYWLNRHRQLNPQSYNSAQTDNSEQE